MKRDRSTARSRRRRANDGLFAHSTIRNVPSGPPTCSPLHRQEASLPQRRPGAALYTITIRASPKAAFSDGKVGGDNSFFKGIFIRYAVELVNDRHQAQGPHPALRLHPPPGRNPLTEVWESTRPETPKVCCTGLEAHAGAGGPQGRRLSEAETGMAGQRRNAARSHERDERSALTTNSLIYRHEQTESEFHAAQSLRTLRGGTARNGHGSRKANPRATGPTSWVIGRRPAVVRAELLRRKEHRNPQHRQTGQKECGSPTTTPRSPWYPSAPRCTRVLPPVRHGTRTTRRPSGNQDQRIHARAGLSRYRAAGKNHRSLRRSTNSKGPRIHRRLHGEEGPTTWTASANS